MVLVPDVLTKPNDLRNTLSAFFVLHDRIIISSEEKSILFDLKYCNDSGSFTQFLRHIN